MKYTLLTKEELENHYVGEAITVTAVMALLCAAIVAVVIYSLLRSNKGGVNITGGWKFSWN